jgi:AcrR family transcriptional regulator
MASPRRIGVESSETRTQLLDTAEKIMQEEGYAAITTRRIALRAGVSYQLVHYYFRTMDDLYLAMVKHGAGRHLRELESALASEEPLRALWEIYRNPGYAQLAFEYMALANHRKEISAEAKRHTKQLRELETAAVSRFMSECGIDPAKYPPVGIAMMFAALARSMGMEQGVGVSDGHGEATMIVERLFKNLQAARKPARKTPRRR